MGGGYSGCAPGTSRNDENIDDIVFRGSNSADLCAADWQHAFARGAAGGVRGRLSEPVWEEGSLHAAGFHNGYGDLIAQGPGAFVPTPFPPFSPESYEVQFRYENGIRGTTDGLEVAPEWQPTAWWRLKAAYSYLHVNLENQPWFTSTATLTTLHGSSPNSQVVGRSQIDLPAHLEFDQIVSVHRRAACAERAGV
jgi:iron complex outermembrane receptor protein